MGKVMAQFYDVAVTFAPISCNCPKQALSLVGKSDSAGLPIPVRPPARPPCGTLDSQAFLVSYPPAGLRFGGLVQPPGALRCCRRRKAGQPVQPTVQAHG